MEKNKNILILLVVLVLVALGGAVYFLQIQKTKTTSELKPSEVTTTEKGSAIEGEEEQLLDNIYIKKPKDWGTKLVEEKVKGKYTKEEIESAIPRTSCDMTRIKFQKFVKTKDDENIYDDSIFVAKMEDFKRFYSASIKDVEIIGEAGPSKLEKIYDKRKVDEEDFYFREKFENENGKEEIYKGDDYYMLLFYPNAAPKFINFGYIESKDGNFRGFWTLSAFSQDPGFLSLPLFVAVLTDKENVVQFYFLVNTKKIDYYQKKWEEYVKSENPDYNKLDAEYTRFLKSLKEDPEIQSQIDYFVSVVKSISKK